MSQSVLENLCIIYPSYYCGRAITLLYFCFFRIPTPGDPLLHARSRRKTNELYEKYLYARVYRMGPNSVVVLDSYNAARGKTYFTDSQNHHHLAHSFRLRGGGGMGNRGYFKYLPNRVRNCEYEKYFFSFRTRKVLKIFC